MLRNDLYLLKIITIIIRHSTTQSYLLLLSEVVRIILFIMI